MSGHASIFRAWFVRNKGASWRCYTMHFFAGELHSVIVFCCASLRTPLQEGKTRLQQLLNVTDIVSQSPSNFPHNCWATYFTNVLPVQLNILAKDTPKEAGTSGIVTRSKCEFSISLKLSGYFRRFFSLPRPNILVVLRTIAQCNQHCKNAWSKQPKRMMTTQLHFCAGSILFLTTC